jgi:hypothetical protein
MSKRSSKSKRRIIDKEEWNQLTDHEAALELMKVKREEFYEFATDVIGPFSPEPTGPGPRETTRFWTELLKHAEDDGEVRYLTQDLPEKIIQELRLVQEIGRKELENRGKDLR